MKKILLLLALVFAINSCSVKDDGPNYHYEVLPVESFTVPESFYLGQTYPIKVTYKKPTDCHTFVGFYYEKNGNVRTIAVQTSVLDNSACQPISEEPVEVSFNFQCTYSGTYIFKFYKGTDAVGNDVFEEVEIPVY